MKSTTEKQKHWQDRPGDGPLPVTPKVSFPGIDHDVLSLWEDRNIFQRTISEREGCPDYVAYDGPPGTNGVPHIGHIMQSALKDLWPRYFTMKGYKILRKAGWDTHGLPVELTAEKELGLHSKQDIEEYGIEKYIDYCRKTVFRYKDAWTKTIRRCGRFLDVDDYYATLTTDYIQTDWWVLKQAWEKKLLYQGKKVMPHCTRCGTSLSSHETAQGYADVTDISLYVKFPVKNEKDTFFVAWTTTAWTLLSNVALAVNPDLKYVTINIGTERLILAEDRLEQMSDLLGEYTIEKHHTGKDLEGLAYEPLWSFLKGVGDKAHHVVADNYVTADDGSGIVHLALYGEDDFRIIKEKDIPMVQFVDIHGTVIDDVKPFAGRWFKEDGLDIDILKNLLGNGLLLGKKKLVHSYPHCYRCDTPLMYFAKSAWFIATSKIKDRLLAANENINWFPNHIKKGRFGNWLENVVDWNISRERYWGSPLPIWTCTDCGEQLCVGSFEDLSALLPEPLPENFDPHKPGIDNIELTCGKCNGKMAHEREVLDPWFNAGIMPWGQWGYPAKDGSKDNYENQYPCDFICEAIDQTRGWFYTLLVASTLLTDRSSYKNVICTEHVLDDDGHKMSKSRGNIVEPIGVCDKFGGDAVRWNFYAFNPWTVRRFKNDDMIEALKQILIPYWNAYSFFTTYALVDGWKPGTDLTGSKHELDRWILSRLEGLREEVEAGLQNYDVSRAAGAIGTHIDELTNWYIRRSRRRFWKSEDDLDKKDAYNTLYFELKNLNRIMAPFLPFVTEAVFQNLERGFEDDSPDSVHLCFWPEERTEMRSKPLEEDMDLTRRISSIGRALRNEAGIRVRQPMKEVVVSGVSEEFAQQYGDLINDELNVKSFRVESNPKALFSYSAKGDFKTLGPRFGKNVKTIIQAIQNLSAEDLDQLVKNGKFMLDDETIELADVILTQEAVDGYWVRSDGDLTVAVDQGITEELHAEWLAREFVHHVQNLRRERDLEVTQRIRIDFCGDERVVTAIKKNLSYICTETLTNDLVFSEDLTEVDSVKIGDSKGKFKISFINRVN
ncbi:MAG: isoleucine--tRNA ligase [Calditrichaeota bacterium]|nr:isoleucine--tRNA ligase [Calditrichota bacterium]MBT7787773.1 isoleucine--tRNA ligase [Calditrichota bacterium]